MKRYTKVKVIRITEEQHKTLVKMKSYNIDVGNFIRNAIKEKIDREQKGFVDKKKLDSFSVRISKCILDLNK